MSSYNIFRCGPMELRRGAKLCQGVVTTEQISDEPMLYSANLEFAMKHGGSLTKSTLEALFPHLHAWEHPGHIVIDTRVHMLMRGMIPAIPGWHCDAVKRNERFGQPDVTSINLNMPHFTCTISDNYAGVSNTEFLNETLRLRLEKTRVWGSLNDKLVEREKTLKTTQMRDGEIWTFSQRTPHRAMPCHNPGWRFWFRLSFMRSPAQNKIRRQTQVYTTEGGW